MPPARCLKTGEVARIFGVGQDSVRRWMKAGYLPAWRTPGGHFRFTTQDVAALLERLDYPLDRLEQFLIR